MKIEELLNEDDKKFRHTLLIDLENLESQISRVPVQFFDINYIYAKASIAYDNAKRDLKKTEKHVYRSVKLQLDQMKVKVSEKGIEAKVEGNSLYLKAYDNYLAAKAVYEMLKVKKESLDLKVKMMELSHEGIKSKMFLKSKLTK